ncbi:hypothetical protein SOV_30010 [Sporomusa ovata DSM 2662]|uniref:Uncharacterized protein n=1 Tax=Sporomusa ovata TaxID=2378 RepID=A0A0U1KRX0_9FIRM|nr:hypothetical protein [Sporomusa ovata]EQB24970.1 hypothetical protein SOV_5c01040 [Sporomusa ovata DSM 2662]CQR70170.1 hypothetical protein SpAn4DRAFT_4682 [Sporomusa ovata]
MSLLPEFSISFWNGWWFSLIYFIVNQGIPLRKKGSAKCLLTAANSEIIGLKCRDISRKREELNEKYGFIIIG